MDHHKGFISLLLLAFIALLLIGGGVYAYVQNKQTASTAQTADWKTYANTNYKFEVKYPTGYSTFHTSGDSSIDFRSTEACKALTPGGGEWPTDCQAYGILIQKNKITGPESSSIVVAGIQAEKIMINGGMWDNMTQIVVQFQKGQNWYVQTFTFNQGKSQVAEGIMNQILLTFKFNQ